MKRDLVKDHVLHALQSLSQFAGKMGLPSARTEIELCIQQIRRLPISPGPYPMCRHRNKAYNPCNGRGYCPEDPACND